MKISIGTNIKEGPWGGGNLFAINLKRYLQNKGHKVLSSLDENDIDIILITEPRKTLESSAFTHTDVERYLKYVNNKTLVVHRINECDERKGTNYVNKYLINANNVADYTVFVSNWIKTLYENQGIPIKNNIVIMAGADKGIFNDKGRKKESKREKYKIVTHHWGNNWNKGFETYLKLDELLNNESYKNKISFTYVGNIPKNVKFQNSKVVEPLSGEALANEIKKHDIYLTGSINEPSGNHHIEGAQCGLPLLFIESGGIPEYCNGFGEMFNSTNFEEKLNKLINKYDDYEKLLNNYPNSSDKMCKEYEEIFTYMYENSKKILDLRTINLTKSYGGSLVYNLVRKLNNFLKMKAT